MRKILLGAILLICISGKAQVLSVREQSKLVNEILEERLNNVLPLLMERTGIEMWVIMSREYNEDPVLKTMLPAEWLNARRRTILVFYNNPQKKQYEKLAVARYDAGDKIKASWDMQRFPNQWDALVDIIKTRSPKNIAVNTSTDFGHADGLDQTDYFEFMQKLPAAFRNKVVSAESLAVAWLETRTEHEMQLYPQLVDATHKIIEEGFSEKVIVPGVTTTDDLVWWFRQKIRNLGYDTWFHPSVSIQRNDQMDNDQGNNFSSRPKSDTVLAGDLLHVDIGITYLRLNTDVQQHAYILKPGEKTVPRGLKDAFVKANRLQDILTSQFKDGKTGNQILSAALLQARKEGLQPSIYTHPIGYHGHAAGPAIGMWDQQNAVTGTGDYSLQNNTAYSIELNNTATIPEWKKSIKIMLEEDGYFDENGFRYINERQKEIYLVPRQ